MKLGKDISKKNKNIGNVAETNVLQKPEECDYSRIKNECYLEQDVSISLQAAFETFMKNPQIKYIKENSAMKRGLCYIWLSNNYVCLNQQCLYSHNALDLFKKKLKQYPSKFIITVVISMRNDLLFVDVVMAAFKVVSKRKIPFVWVAFLSLFVFYVTEPSDSRFLKFWSDIARFFCELQKNSEANGFASVLSIFCHFENSEQRKIIEFIKFIKQPPLQVCVNFALLQPVLKMDLPSEFLIEAIESCVTTQKDVLKVYYLLLPKICIMTSPIEVVELLLKFGRTLEGMNQKNCANDLKLRLRVKIFSLKTKISDGKYPLTASFQEEIYFHSGETDSYTTSVGLPKEESNMDSTFMGFENGYFQAEDVRKIMIQIMQPSDVSIPVAFRNTAKSDAFMRIRRKIMWLNRFSAKQCDRVRLPCEKCRFASISIARSERAKRLSCSPCNTDFWKLLKLKRLKEIEDDICKQQITRIKQFFRKRQFDLFGKCLNDLRSNVIEPAAQEFLNLLFRMKISLKMSVDLVRILLFFCESENAAKFIAIISVTLILNLVRINEWKKAYTIVSLCQPKQINLVEGKVFNIYNFNTVTQCRVVLLLIEIQAYKGNFETAVDLVRKYFLFSSNNSLWRLTWKASDETVRVRILEDLLGQMISNRLSKSAYYLFEMIWKDQKQLLGPVDLRKFLNEIIILLLNQEDEEALNLYEEIEEGDLLNDTTVRAVAVTLVRRNNLSAAKSLVLSAGQNAYFTPKTIHNSAVVTVLSFWLDEEIYIVFDTFFDLLITQKTDFNLADYSNFEIQLQELKPNLTLSSGLRPLCLGIINPSIQGICTRIQRVLEFQFNPPVKLIIMPHGLKLDRQSVKLHLKKRMGRNPL